MAGYRRKSKQYLLKFQDPEMEGFECLTKSVSVDEFTGISALAAEMATGTSGDLSQIMRKFTDSIITWNLEEEDGTPVPIAYAVCRVSGKPGNPGHPCEEHVAELADDPNPPACEYYGLCSQDIGFVMDVLTTWMSAVASVDIPLLPGLNNGGVPPEVSQQLANLSRNLTN
jgi:hypothetical protein